MIQIDRQPGHHYADNLLDPFFNFNDSATWTVSSGTGSATHSSLRAFEGQRSLYMQNTDPTTDFIITTTKETTIPRTGNYQYSLYARKEEPTTALDLEVKVFKNGTLFNTQPVNIQTDGKWLRFILSGTYDFNAGDKITFSFNLKGIAGTGLNNTDVYIDGVMLNAGDRLDSIPPHYNPIIEAQTSAISDIIDTSKKPFETMQQLVDLYAEFGGSVVYTPVGMVDAGDIPLEVGSEKLLIVGNSYFVSGIYSNEDNYTMFRNASGEFVGNVDIRQCSFYASGANSKLIDLDGTGNSGAIEFSSCNIGDFAGSTTEIGTLTSFRQFKASNCGFFRTQGSLKFAGTWSGGFRITETIVLAQGANTKLFEPVAGLTFAGRCISDINAASVDPTTITFDFVPENFLLNGGFQLSSASFAPNSSISVTTDETSTKAFFRDCIEIRNTRPGFESEWTTNTVTPLTSGAPPTKALGATVINNETWFEQISNNEWGYLSSLTKDLNIDVDINVDGSPNVEISVHVMHYDDSASTWLSVKSKTRIISNFIGGADIALFTFKTRIDDFAENDKISIYLENETDGSDATILAGSEIYVEVL